MADAGVWPGEGGVSTLRYNSRMRHSQVTIRNVRTSRCVWSSIIRVIRNRKKYIVCQLTVSLAHLGRKPRTSANRAPGPVPDPVDERPRGSTSESGEGRRYFTVGVDAVGSGAVRGTRHEPRATARVRCSLGVRSRTWVVALLPLSGSCVAEWGDHKLIL